MSELVERLKKELQDEDYRYAYDEEFANARMATQIRALREQQELKQSALAELAGMRQSRISELENINYNSWSISTLRRLARALGVRLAFSFESWGELLPEADSFGRKAFERPRFERDPAFHAEAETVNVNSKRFAQTASQQTSLRVISGTSTGVIQSSFTFNRPQLVHASSPQQALIQTTEETDTWQKIRVAQ